MSFGATPLDGSSPTPIPMSSVVPDGASTPVALEGGPSLSSGGNTLAPASMYVKDGNDVTLGLSTQTKATDGSTTSWSVIQLLKGIFDRLINSTIAVTQSGTWTVQPGNTANTTAWLTQAVAGAGGGSTPTHLLSAASNNATTVKASAGTLYGFSVANTNAAVRWLKFYNKASNPAPATDNALIVWTVQAPANGLVIETFPEGMNFSTGIAFATVVNASDTDNTSVGAGDLSVDIRSK